MTAPRVELRGVGHAYGGRVVLSGVDRVLEPGRALGLLGPNGSGKSTLLRCIAGLLRPRAGSVLVDGRESCELAPAERARVAYAGHRPLLWGGLSARENLLLCAGLYGLGPESAERALETADLAEAAERPAAALSQGQRQRLALARALLPAPQPARARRAAQRARRGERRPPRRAARPGPRRGDDRARDARALARGAALRRAHAPRGAALSSRAVPFARAVGLLVRTDVVLERRAPQLALAMGLFAAVAQVVLHYGADIASPPVALTVGSLWVTLLLATLLAVARVFNAERDEGLLDALVLAPIPRTAIWAAKAIAIGALLVLMEIVAVPLSYLFLPADAPVPQLGTLLLSLAAGDIGLAALGSLVAAVASAVRGREVMVPLLYLPAAVPLLIAALACSVHASSGESVVRPLALVLLYDAIVALLAYAVCEHALTD